jgi:hypothetical protein
MKPTSPINARAGVGRGNLIAAPSPTILMAISTMNAIVKPAAHSSSKRSAYQDVCGLIRRYKNIVGKDNTAELVNELLVLYKKKRAFVYELSKLD